MAGIMAGAAKCFYGFVGFDCVATTGEEAKNPKRNIPLSIVFSLIIIFLAYFGVSTVLTMMWPYYAQVNEIKIRKYFIFKANHLFQHPEAPLPHVYEQIGWTEVKWIVSVGAVFALCTSLLGAMFPLPRILYAMSSDGLIYSSMKRVNNRTKTPLNATLFSGLVAAVMALIFDLHQLIDMMSIGTLLAYTIVAVCVLVLRYQDENMYCPNEIPSTQTQILRQICNLNNIKRPTTLSSNISKSAIILYCVCATAFCIFIDIISFDDFYVAHVFLLASVIIMFVLFIVILRQPKSECNLSFKVPLIPFIPMLSILINLYLMFQLDFHTWIRFGVWLLIGYIIYFTYGIHRSIEGNRKKLELSEHGCNGKNLRMQNAPKPIEPHTMQSMEDNNSTNGSSFQLHQK